MPQKQFVCAQCKKIEHKFVCDIAGCKRLGKPFDSQYHLDQHKQGCSKQWNHFCRVPGCNRASRGFATDKRRVLHEKTCRQRRGNAQFTAAIQGLLPEEANLTDALGLEEIPAITTSSDAAAPAAA